MPYHRRGHEHRERHCKLAEERDRGASGACAEELKAADRRGREDAEWNRGGEMQCGADQQRAGRDRKKVAMVSGDSHGCGKCGRPPNMVTGYSTRPRCVSSTTTARSAGESSGVERARNLRR